MSLNSCSNDCISEVFNYNPGIIGNNYESNGLMLVLHRLDDLKESENGKSNEQSINISRLGEAINNLMYSKEFKKSATGILLGNLLSESGLTFDDVYIINLIKCLFPEDKLKVNGLHKSCYALLKEQIMIAKPEKIVVFGERSFRYMFPEIAASQSFESVVLNKRLYGDIPSMIMYGPHKLYALDENRQKSSMDILKQFYGGI